MRIVFIDPADCFDYNPATPRQKPLGGTQSSISYLTAELAKRGHRVALVNWTSRPGVYEGVECPGWDAGYAAHFLASADAIVAVNATLGVELRRMLGDQAPLVLWTQHAADEPAVHRLRDEDERGAWNLIAYVTDWQRREYAKTFGIAGEGTAVLKNAAAPVFDKRKRSMPPFWRRGEPPTLIYTSTPFRGLDVLLIAFPSIRRLVPGCRLRVFSSMAIYGVAADKDGGRALYDLCRALDGVEYKGVVGQEELADELLRADILAYPNTFPEMACIAVMEAMVAGCVVLTSKLAALPETTAGFGYLLEPVPAAPVHATDFAGMVAEVVRRATADPDQFDRLIEAQTNFARMEYSWATRAKEWEPVLSAIPKGRVTAA